MEQTHRKMLPKIFLQKIIYLEKIEDTEIFVKNILLGDDAFFFFLFEDSPCGAMEVQNLQNNLST